MPLYLRKRRGKNCLLHLGITFVALMYRGIDGREEVKAHGPRTMPLWGVELQVVEGSELRATGRILELIYYLKSIQEK